MVESESKDQVIEGEPPIEQKEDNGEEKVAVEEVK